MASCAGTSAEVRKSKYAAEDLEQQIESNVKSALQGLEDATVSRRLAERLRGRRCTVNLIPFNPVDETGFERPSAEAVERYRAILQGASLVATVRWSRGVESSAACGQLKGNLEGQP